MEPRLEVLSSLPLQLTHESGADVFKKASQALVRLLEHLCFVRWQLVSEALEPTDTFDLCGPRRMSAQLSALPYPDTCLSQVVAAAHKAPREQDPQRSLFLANDGLGPSAPPDLLLLQRGFGARSCCVAPIVLGREVLGALCVASPQGHAFSDRQVQDLRAVVAMVAPHAAMLRRSTKSGVARTVLGTMLPLRVLELIDQRLGRKTVHDF